MRIGFKKRREDEKVRYMLQVMLFAMMAFCMTDGASAAPFQNLKDLHKVHENNAEVDVVPMLYYLNNLSYHQRLVGKRTF